MIFVKSEIEIFIFSGFEWPKEVSPPSLSSSHSRRPSRYVETISEPPETFWSRTIWNIASFMTTRRLDDIISC